MKKIVLVAILCITSTSIFAQNKAKSLLDEVYNQVKSYKNIAIEFKYSLDNKEENIHQETQGDVTISGDKYVFNYLGATKLFDGQKIYTVVPDNEEVTIENKNSEDKDAITPSKMLTFYKDGYNYSMDISQNIKGRKIQYVKLTPIDSNSEIKNILLGIDTQTKNIYNLIQTANGGSTTTTITVTSFKTDQPLPPNMFAFNMKKYKDDGYYIIQN
ncbi:outer membrane lipoprotein carrier protein LolA [Zhouia sp. PK063]|uniref:outer membrane lipoprotein carrier protein LolA n=1 Tax=Zhouia sp. PK063 TaxID=3373602 RepID=UPI0037A4B55A